MDLCIKVIWMRGPGGGIVISGENLRQKYQTKILDKNFRRKCQMKILEANFKVRNLRQRQFRDKTAYVGGQENQTIKARNSRQS